MKLKQYIFILLGLIAYASGVNADENEESCFIGKDFQTLLNLKEFNFEPIEKLIETIEADEKVEIKYSISPHGGYRQGGNIIITRGEEKGLIGFVVQRKIKSVEDLEKTGTVDKDAYDSAVDHYKETHNRKKPTYLYQYDITKAYKNNLDKEAFNKIIEDITGFSDNEFDYEFEGCDAELVEI